MKNTEYYRSYSKGKYNKSGKSKLFSSQTSATQRDTAAVTIKQAMVIHPMFEGNTHEARFAFSPINNIMRSPQM